MPYRTPRRSRIYDSNYNKGHSMYKSALDGIDAKYSLGRTIRESSLPKARIDFGADIAEHSLSEARSRAHRAITEETVFDSKGFKVPKIGIPLKSEIENNFDGEIQSSLDRIRASRLRAMEAEVDLDLPKMSSFARKAKIEMNDAMHGLENATESTNYIKKRALKLVATTAVDSAMDSNHLTKWSKISNTEDSHSLAQKRAMESKHRLRELEDDMQMRSERQDARERRAINLKKMINSEFNMNGIEDELKAIAY